MKILHALVGYLAVTALPFYPFSFAYPLATIDYDGYMNTTQNHVDGALTTKQVLGSVETCQTITTQNHSDIIEGRQYEVPIPVVVVILALVTAVSAIVTWITEDNPVRSNDV